MTDKLTEANKEALRDAQRWRDFPTNDIGAALEAVKREDR